MEETDFSRRLRLVAGKKIEIMGFSTGKIKFKNKNKNVGEELSLGVE